MRNTSLLRADRNKAHLGRLVQLTLPLAAAACLAPAATAEAAAPTKVPAAMPQSKGTVKYLSPGDSVQSALNNASAGDRLLLRPGTYSGNVETNAKGSSSNPITITSASGGTAVIKGGFKVNGGGYLRVTGLKFDGKGTNGWGTSVWNSDHVEISYNEITGYPGIAQGILLKEGSDDVQMLGNRIHDVGGEWPEHEHAIYCDSANRPIMANNLIYSSRAGYGIHLFGNCDNALVTNNTVTTSQTSGITIGGNSDRGTTDNALIQNNIVADNANGGNGSYGWGVTSYQEGSGNVIRNNLFHNNSKGSVNCGKCSVSGNKVADPMFVNAGARDYRVKSGSPALSAASDVGLTVDFVKARRPQGSGPEMGAYESGSSAPAPAPAPAPEPEPQPAPQPQPEPQRRSRSRSPRRSRSPSPRRSRSPRRSLSPRPRRPRPAATSRSTVPRAPRATRAAR